MFRFGLNYKRLKKNLKLAVARTQLLTARKIILSEQMKQKVADSLKEECFDEAWVTADFSTTLNSMIAAVKIIGDMCQELLSRFKDVKRSKKMDEAMARCVSSIAWCTSKLDREIPELRVITKQLSLRYGPTYIDACKNKLVLTVDEKLVKLLENTLASEEAVQEHVSEIAASYGVPYEPETPNKPVSVKQPAERSPPTEIKPLLDSSVKTLTAEMEKIITNHSEPSPPKMDTEPKINPLDIWANIISPMVNTNSVNPTKKESNWETDSTTNDQPSCSTRSKRPRSRRRKSKVQTPTRTESKTGDAENTPKAAQTERNFTKRLDGGKVEEQIKIGDRVIRVRKNGRQKVFFTNSQNG